MEQAHEQEQLRRAAAPVAPEVEPVTPVPSAPVPMVAGTMVVGHAEDHAERDADLRADTALSRLARVSASGGEGGGAGAHQHGAGCDHLRRLAPAAPAAAAGEQVVGHEGGALDAGTSDAIQRTKGGGRPLEGGVLDRMQTAFGSDFSRVRVHDDAASVKLNRAVSARAFTTGRDIFFGAGEYSPDTPQGERVLAHELAHTLQPAGPTRRLADYQWPEGTGPDRTVVADQAPPDRAPAEEPVDAVATSKHPSSLAELLATPNIVVRGLLGRTSVDGPLMAILLDAFEGDWFKAKDCLVFGRWPGEGPKMTPATAIDLMTAFTALRVEVHKAVAARTGPMVKFELAERAKQLQGNTKLASKLKGQQGKTSAQQVKHFGPGGADTPTSDVDVSSGGDNSEVAVRVYNQQFRKLLKTEFDPGTVFDLNVYAKDFIFDEQLNANKTEMTASRENSGEARDAQGQAHADEEQDIYALVHVARFMDATQWQQYIDETLAAITDEKKKTSQRRLFATARNRCDAFEEMLRSTMDELASKVQHSLKTAETSAWKDGANDGFASDALKMRAANMMYENKLLQVKELREEIAELVAAKGTLSADPERLATLVTEVAKAVSVASLYANEVYGSDGGTVHAVIAVQRARKREAANRDEVKKGTRDAKDVSVKANMSPEQWSQAFTDNLGDVMKDYAHYGKPHGAHTPDFRYAAFKMGKYVDRMVDTVGKFGDQNVISPTDSAALSDNPERELLAELAGNHVRAKAGEPGQDPKKLKDDPWFADKGQGDVEAYAAAALKLGAKVRGMVANHKPAMVGPELPAPSTRADEPAPETMAAERAKVATTAPEPVKALAAALESALLAQGRLMKADAASGP